MTTFLSDSSSLKTNYQARKKNSSREFKKSIGLKQAPMFSPQSSLNDKTFMRGLSNQQSKILPRTGKKSSGNSYSSFGMHHFQKNHGEQGFPGFVARKENQDGQNKPKRQTPGNNYNILLNKFFNIYYKINCSIQNKEKDFRYRTLKKFYYFTNEKTKIYNISISFSGLGVALSFHSNFEDGSNFEDLSRLEKINTIPLHLFPKREKLKENLYSQSNITIINNFFKKPKNIINRNTLFSVLLGDAHGKLGSSQKSPEKNLLVNQNRSHMLKNIKSND